MNSLIDSAAKWYADKYISEYFKYRSKTNISEEDVYDSVFQAFKEGEVMFAKVVKDIIVNLGKGRDEEALTTIRGLV